MNHHNNYAHVPPSACGHAVCDENFSLPVVLIFVEIFEGLGDEDGGTALGAQLREDEVLELVLGQDLEEGGS